MNGTNDKELTHHQTNKQHREKKTMNLGIRASAQNENFNWRTRSWQSV